MEVLVTLRAVTNRMSENYSKLKVLSMCNVLLSVFILLQEGGGEGRVKKDTLSDGFMKTKHTCEQYIGR